MRLTRSIGPTLLLALAACSASLTAPPNGLPVTLTSVSFQSVQVASITSADDSVTAMVPAAGFAACGGPMTADAGLRAGALIMTLTQTQRGPCPPGVTGVLQLPVEIVVHDVPSGARAARVVLRLVTGDNATYSTLASGTIRLP